MQKVSALNIEVATASSGSKSGPKPELSRREKEEIDKQKSQAAYQKLHSQGKTEQAKADLARLAIIKQQRQEAADRREKERKGTIFLILKVQFFKRLFLQFAFYRIRYKPTI